MSYFCLFFTAVMLLSGMTAVQADSGHNSVFENLDWTELRPSAIQSESMIEDEPGGRPVIDQVSADLWMAGRNFIWKWSLRDGALSRVAIPVGVKRPFRLAHASEKSVIALDGINAWVLDLVKSNWRKLDGHLEGNCVPDRLIPLKTATDTQSNGVYFVTDCGVYMALMTSGQLIRVTDNLTSADFKDVTDAVAFGQGGSILAISDRELVHFKGRGNKVQRDVFYTAKSKLLGLTISGDRVLAWTSQALLVFDRRLKRQQVIPVLGTRKIQGFMAGKTHHMIGFTDGTIEMMDLDRQRKWATAAGGFAARFIDFALDDQLVVLSTVNAPPRVFSMTSLR